MKTKLLATFAALSTLSLAACTTPTPPAPTVSVNKGALPTMERVALAANKCWFKSKDKDFQGYTLAPELNSYSGRPRILVVPGKNPAGRPLLVVQAEGNPAKLEVFGPMLNDSHGGRINRDVYRWAAGQNNC